MTSISYDPREEPRQLRATDSQREVVAELVQRAVSDGRLQLSEVDERLDAIYNARTHGELGAVIDDLVPRRLPVYRPAIPSPAVSERKILPAFLLCFFVGALASTGSTRAGSARARSCSS